MTLDERVDELGVEVERLRKKIRDCHTALNDIEQWFRAERRETLDGQRALDVVKDIRLQSSAEHQDLKDALDGGGPDDG